jgi:hypothetical protein
MLDYKHLILWNFTIFKCKTTYELLKSFKFNGLLKLDKQISIF